MHTRSAVLTLLMGITTLPPAAGAQQWNDSTTKALVHDADAFIQEAFATHATPGLGVAIVVDGHTVYNQAFGWSDAADRIPATPETLWYVASTTKSFTGFAMALLAERGEVDLNAPITKVLPTAQWHPDAHPEQLDVMAFLTHTHGLDGNGPVVIRTAFTGEYTDQELLKLLRFHAPTGSRAFAYSNLGYVVAGLIIDAVRPEGWKAYLRKQVFLPAGMMNTFARFDGIDRARIAQPHALQADGSYARQPFQKTDATMHAAGGHIATTGDLARWIALHMNDGVLDGRRIFPAALVRSTHRVRVPQDRNFAFFHRHGWGIGWDIGTYESDTLIHRFGGYMDFRSHVSFMPQRRVGVIATTNGNAGSTLTDIIAAYVYDRAAGRPAARQRGETRLAQLQDRIRQARTAIAADQARRAARPQSLLHPLSAYAGTYFDEALGHVVWRVVDQHLQVQWGVLHGPTEVYNGQKDQLRIELLGRGQVVQFHFDDGTNASSLTLAGRTFRREQAQGQGRAHGPAGAGEG